MGKNDEKTPIGKILAFVFVWTLLVLNISISATTRVVSFGFRGLR